MCVHRACVCGYDVANGACALVYDIDCHKIYHPRVFISLSSSSVVAWCLPLSKHLYTQVIRTLGRVCTRSLACSSHSNNAYGIGHTISAPVTVVPAYILHYNTGCVENQMGYVHGFSLLCKYISIFHFLFVSLFFYAWSQLDVALTIAVMMMVTTVVVIFLFSSLIHRVCIRTFEWIAETVRLLDIVHRVLFHSYAILMIKRTKKKPCTRWGRFVTDNQETRREA